MKLALLRLSHFERFAAKKRRWIMKTETEKSTVTWKVTCTSRTDGQARTIFTQAKTAKAAVKKVQESNYDLTDLKAEIA